MDNLFTALMPVWGDKGVHSLLRSLYRAKSECFEIVGTLHNSIKGDETYLSLKIHQAPTTSGKSMWNDYHVYGSLRGNKFTVFKTHYYSHSADEEGNVLKEPIVAYFQPPTSHTGSLVTKGFAHKGIWS